MYQIADNQLSDAMDSLTVIQSLWNGMVPLLAGMIKSEFSIMVLILVKQKLLLLTSVI